MNLFEFFWGCWFEGDERGGLEGTCICTAVVVCDCLLKDV